MVINSWKTAWIGVVAVVLFCIGVAVWGHDTHSVITRSQYNQLAEGMQYGACVDVINTPGYDESILIRLDQGKPVVVRTVVWNNPNGSGARVVFEDDLLYVKVQSGL